MKYLKYISTLVILLSVMACTSPADKSIVVFFDNDVHCEVNGYPYFVGLRDAINTDTAYVALVSSGDYIQGDILGSISKGEAITSIVSKIGYDAMALGNHEFDYGVQHLKNLLDDQDLPVVCCNFTDMDGTPIFTPYRIKEYGTRKIAFVGASTVNTFYSSISAFKDFNGNVIYDFHRHDLYDVVQNAVNDARKQGADYVVLLSHIGEDPDSINISSHKLIENTRGIDVLLDAHTHSVVRPMKIKNLDGKDVILAQTGTKFQYAGKLVIGKDGEMTAELIPIFSLNQESVEKNLENLGVNAAIKQYVDTLADYYSHITEQVVGECDFKICVYDENGVTIGRNKEIGAGNLAADALQDFVQSDVAMVNAGGMRNDIKPGVIKRGDVIAFLPYDNTVVSFTLKGRELVQILNDCFRSLPAMTGNFPQIAGMRVRVNVKGYGQNAITYAEVFDQKTQSYKQLDPDADYTLATTSYYATSEQYESMHGEYRDYVDHCVSYTEVTVHYIQEKLGGKVPSRYQTEEGRMVFEYKK